MADKSPAFADQVIDATFGTGSVTPPANYYVSLHTAEPTGNDQSSNEVGYTGYARQAVAVPAGWTITNNQAANAALIQFPASTGGAQETVTYVGLGTSLTGTGQLVYKPQAVQSIVVDVGIDPKIQPGQATFTET